MSSDCEKLLNFWTYLPLVMVGPLVLLIVAWCSYIQMGYPALFGLGTILLMFPFQGDKSSMEKSKKKTMIKSNYSLKFSPYINSLSFDKRQQESKIRGSV